MTRTVRDGAMLYAQISQPDWRDWHADSSMSSNFIGRLSEGVKGKKINKSISSNVKKILKCNEKDIFICSTGVIGEQIPLRPTNKSITQSLRNSSSNWKDCSKAITTTDTFPKG